MFEWFSWLFEVFVDFLRDFSRAYWVSIPTVITATIIFFLNIGVLLISSIFPDPSGMPSVSAPSLVGTPFEFVLGMYATLIDPIFFSLTLSFIFIFETFILTIAFMRWLWGWVVG